MFFSLFIISQLGGNQLCTNLKSMTNFKSVLLLKKRNQLMIFIMIHHPDGI